MRIDEPNNKTEPKPMFTCLSTNYVRQKMQTPKIHLRKLGGKKEAKEHAGARLPERRHQRQNHRQDTQKSEVEIRRYYLCLSLCFPQSTLLSLLSLA
jgi:hypothetical protein